MVSFIKGKSKEETFYPIFKNPDKSEIAELRKFGVNVRFIAFDNNVFIFPAEILHDWVIRHLSSEKIVPNNLYSKDKKTVMLGVGKIIPGKTKMTIELSDNMKTWSEIFSIRDNFPYIDKWFE